MKLFRRTLVSTLISTITVFSGSSAIADAAILTSKSNFTGTNFQKDGPMTKVGSDLALLYAKHEALLPKAEATTFPLTNPWLQVHDNHVLIDAVTSSTTEDLSSDLEKLGLQEGTSKFGSIVSGALPIKAIDKVAKLDSLQFARPSYRPLTSVGLTTSQADVAVKADVARSQLGVDGTGVTVGILSDSFDYLGKAADDVASGDLPSDIKVLKDFSQGGTDEGRAIAQLIHDVAPGAKIAFHTSQPSQTALAKGIIKLANVAKADIIVDDATFLNEPMFQDGVAAQAVDKVVAKGVSYFSAAGNWGRNAYESAFVPSGIQERTSDGEFHDFDSGSGVDTFQSITVPKDTAFGISFQWDSPFFSASGTVGSPNDLDVFLYNQSGTKVLASSTENNINGDAVELFPFINDGSYGTNQFNLAIANSAGPDPELMKYILFNFTGTINEYNTASSTLFGHKNTNGAEAVGAAFYGDTPEFGTDPALLETFSSPGPTPILFDQAGNRLETPELRQKPEIVAPDGTNTTFFTPGVDVEKDGFPNFLGTSAAAPHAAAVAALMLDAAPGTSPSEIYSILENTALDMDDPATPGFDSGYDFASGYGLIQADRAVKAVPEPSSTLAALTFGALSATLLLKRSSQRGHG